MIRNLFLAWTLSLSLVSLADAGARRYEKWVDAPLGIAITKCDYTTRGVHVKFETDIEPPYVVGVYRPAEEGLGRRFPVAEVETFANSALVPGNFTDVTLFVQVMSKSVANSYAADTIGRRILTQAEWQNYVDVIKSARPYVNSDASISFETDNGICMEIVDDYTWAGFVKTALTNLSFSVFGDKVDRQGGDPVPHEYSFSISTGRNDIGTGYRIMMFEDTGVCQAQRAYSALTNMSDTVVLPRGFRALSSHNGYVYTTDWEGRGYFQKVTNRVDHVFGN